MSGSSIKHNSIESPMDRLHNNESIHMRFKPKDENAEKMWKSVEKCGSDAPYRELVGSLQWLAN